MDLVHSFPCEAECLLQVVEVSCLPTFNCIKTTGLLQLVGNVKYPKLNGYFESASIHLSVWEGLWRDKSKIFSQKEIKKFCRY